MNTINGVISHLPREKTFGFIKGEDGKEYFFHRDDFQGFWEDLLIDFYTGNVKIEVVFIPSQGEKGLRAVNVSRKDWPN